MGYSLTEFAQVLPLAMRDWVVVGAPPRWAVQAVDGGPIAEIRVEPREPRCVGALQIPVLHVTLRIAAVPAALSDEFLRRFERGFRRGGG